MRLALSASLLLAGLKSDLLTQRLVARMIPLREAQQQVSSVLDHVLLDRWLAKNEQDGRVVVQRVCGHDDSGEQLVVVVLLRLEPFQHRLLGAGNWALIEIAHLLALFLMVCEFVMSAGWRLVVLVSLQSLYSKLRCHLTFASAACEISVLEFWLQVLVALPVLVQFQASLSTDLSFDFAPGLEVF